MTGKQGGDMAFPMPCMFLDVPFSLVGDTLFLPFDAYYTHQVNTYQKELKRNPLDPDPLTGWQADPTVKANTAIEEDYQSYIKQLPLDQKKAFIVNDNLIQSFVDRSGNQAVQIKIVVYQTLWKHVLFYDQSQTRTKVMKYKKDRLIP